MLIPYIALCWFFFFKQKTAYEMRISDWSSDLCSSDLLYSGWKNSLLMGALSGQGLIRMAVDGDALHKADRWDFGIRIREVEVNEDGSVWLLTDGKDGKLVKLVPKG